MWVAAALISAFFLGIYDVAKKKSLAGNSVPTVLFLNTLFCALIFLPYILAPALAPFLESILSWNPDLVSINRSFCPNPAGESASNFTAHILVMAKSAIVLSSWIMGYYALKSLPITITGPINAFRPVLVLLGALLLFGEKLNLLQRTGVIISIISLLLLSISGKKEGIDFRKDRWILLLFGAVIMGAISGLYDKYIIRQLPLLFIQSWFNIYQCIIMGIVLAIIASTERKKTRFRWSWWIPLISIFISIADFAYFYALTYDDALIAVISMIRRGSVIVSFAAGALIFKEKNLKNKAIDLALILLGLILLCLGSLIDS